MHKKLLLTKLQIPPARPGLVRRQRLFEPISQGLTAGRGLTLVSAPAGYGKSVLVAEWLRSLDNQTSPGEANQTNRSVFWYSLETSDNDPERFLSYLAAAFWQNEFDYALEIKGIQDWNDFLPVERLLTDWINSLLQPEQPPVLLVFDDYHRMNEPLVHRIIQFLLNHRPPRLHLILITREDPPLSLSRMRAKAELTELRASDLSFTSEEASEFIRKMHLDLKPDSVLSLTERTEGWITGLHLAALSLRQNRSAEALLEDLKGSHRYLVDYLMDEVLNAQPEDIRQFLCQTALLRRFTPGLCDALTGRDDSLSLLRTLEQTNLFLIPLDEQREWFRYHHLFADCLRKELPYPVKQLLYRKAVRWCLDQDLFEEAVAYALATADDDLAADTIETVLNNPRAWSSGHLSMLEGWLKALPDACIHCRPSLLTVAARALSLAGKFSQAGNLLERAEQMLFSQTQSETAGDDLNLLLAQVGIYRAAITAVGGQLEEARSQVLQAMHRLPPDYHHVKARGLDTLAMIEEQAGNLELSEVHFLEAAACAISAGVAYLAINALCEVAVVRLSQGRLNDAEEACHDALALAEAQPGRIPPAGLAWAIHGDILRERNQLVQAEQYIQTGIDLAREGGLTDDLQQAHLYLARLKLAQGDPVLARQAMKQSLLILKAYRIPRLTRLALMLEAAMALKLGNLPAASSWANAVRTDVQADNREYIQEREKLTLARVWFAENRLSESRQLLETVSSVARDAERNGTLMEALILLALISWQQGDADKSIVTLAEVIERAESHGYVRLFIDEGEPMRQIMAACLRQKQLEPFRAYSEKVLAAFNPAPASDTADVLSSQEVRILSLMAEGASNKVIAGRLFITVGTAKWHVHNIYEKLDVSSRTQAINRGRELGIIG